MRRWVVLPVVVVQLIGCASNEPTVAVSEWMLETSGRTLPAKLPAQLVGAVPREPSRFALTATVPLDASMRGRAISLVLTRCYARAALVIDDERITPLGVSPFDRHRRSQMHQVFSIPARLTDRASLQLRLEVDHRGWFSTSFWRLPRLVAAPAGGAEIESAIVFNAFAVYGAVALLTTLSVVFATLFALRRRRPDGWFALLSIAMALWHLALTGATQVLGPMDLQLVPIATTTIACVTTLGFLRDHLGLDPRVQYASGAFVALGVGSFVAGPTPFHWIGAAASLLDVQVLVALLYQLGLLGLTIRRGGEKRIDAIAIFVAWLVLLGSVFGNKIAVDLQMVPIAWTLFVLTMALLLVRSHSRELSARIVSLEERNRDVAVLNEELRRQIRDRAAALADALARMDGSHGRALFAPAEKIGDRYQIVRSIGAGGMGSVHEVERITDGKHFALKVLAGRRTPSALSRFAREAEVLAQFDHPNLVGIVDVDVDPSGMLFVVMELVKGRSLDGWTPPNEAALRRVLAHVATGLRVLHEHGIVHRDLKPGNVLLADDDVAKIADFGIARLKRDDTVSGDDDTISAENAPMDSSLTRTGIVMGTPAYMAPELAHGAKDAAPSSDIFSFGVMWHELVTGAHPFKQPAVYSAYAGAPSERVISDRPVPDWCAKWVDDCLDSNPERRPTAADVARYLAADN